MSHVIPFKGRPATSVDTDLDVGVLAWVPLAELRQLLEAWPQKCPSSPLLLRDVIEAVAHGLVTSEMSDAEAKTWGWHSAAARLQRGSDMLLLLQEGEHLKAADVPAEGMVDGLKQHQDEVVAPVLVS